MKSADQCIQYIINKCQGICHGDSDFANHLMGVYSLMLYSNAPEHLCLAGLFHSIYGSEEFNPELNITREEVIDYIGKEAEELVFLFCFLRNRDDTILKSKNKDLIYLSIIHLQSIYNSTGEKDILPIIEKHKKEYLLLCDR